MKTGICAIAKNEDKYNNITNTIAKEFYGKDN